MEADRDQLPPLVVDEVELRRRTAPPPTPDDCTVLRDGRRLDSKEAVVAYYVEQGYLSDDSARELLAAEWPNVATTRSIGTWCDRGSGQPRNSTAQLPAMHQY